MADILAEIIEQTRKTVAAARSLVPERIYYRRIQDMGPTRNFVRALQRPGSVQVIAEVKKASPSAGVIRSDFDPVEIAVTYQRHGATCISVLTDKPFFQGDLTHLREIREAVGCPLLRKDFIIDTYQLLEARDAGADCVLLIAECLPGEELRRLHREAQDLGLYTLVEVHDAAELPRVLDCGATLIGVNNRDLRTFTTDLEHTLRLREQIPSDRAVVSESGIRTPQDLERLRAAGVCAVLVGESLMRAPDIGRALDELLGKSPPHERAPGS